MAKLKLDYDFDLCVPPSVPTEADHAAVSRALAAHRKTAQYKKALPKIRRMEAKLRKRREESMAAESSFNGTDEPDLIVGPSREYNDEDRAAVSRAIAESRKKPGHAKAVAELGRTIERIEKANAANAISRTKNKVG